MKVIFEKWYSNENNNKKNTTKQKYSLISIILKIMSIEILFSAWNEKIIMKTMKGKKRYSRENIQYSIYWNGNWWWYDNKCGLFNRYILIQKLSEKFLLKNVSKKGEEEKWRKRYIRWPEETRETYVLNSREYSMVGMPEEGSMIPFSSLMKIIFSARCD